MQLSQQVCRCSGMQRSSNRTPASCKASQTSRTVVRAAPHAQQQQSSSSSLSLQGTAALTAAAAATVLQLCLPAAPAIAAAIESSSTTNPVPAAAAWQPVFGDLSLTAVAPALAAEESEEDVLTEEIALPPQLMQFMEMTQNGPIKDAKKLSALRRSVGFDRSPDGRVFLFTEDGEPFQVKNDMGVPGLLLLRDAGGFCYYLPRAESASLVQIDLSDDAVVAQLFANHAWEELVEPLEVLADTPAAASQQQQQQQKVPEGAEMAGRLEQLRLTERQFRSVVSLVAGSQDLPEEPLEELDRQEH